MLQRLRGCPGTILHNWPPLCRATLIFPWFFLLTSSSWVSLCFCFMVKFIRGPVCYCVHACLCVCVNVWVDRVIGPVNVLDSAQGKRCCSVRTVWCVAELWGCGKAITVDFRGNWGRMRKLRTDRPNGCAEARGCRPTAASHPSGPACTAKQWRIHLQGTSVLGLSIRAGSVSICNKFMEFVLKSLEGLIYSDAMRGNIIYDFVAAATRY